MGADYYAYAVIGCEVTGKLYKPAVEPGCLHKNPPTQAFCGTCGKKTVKHTEIPIDGFDPDDNLLVFNGRALKVVHTTDDERAFAGLTTTAIDHRDSATRIDLDTFAREMVQEVLEPLGLWDPTSFGIWSVLFCSY
jgi:hypothetical protein